MASVIAQTQTLPCAGTGALKVALRTKAEKSIFKITAVQQMKVAFLFLLLRKFAILFLISSTGFLHFIFSRTTILWMRSSTSDPVNAEGYHWVVNLNRRQKGGGNAAAWFA